MGLDQASVGVETGKGRIGRLAAGLFVLGLLIRLAALPLWGTFDTEIWKAWSARAASGGVHDMYGPPDRELRRLAREAGVGLLDLPVPRTVFEWRHAEYFVDYPPGSLVVQWAVGRLYRLLDPTMRNGPAFNAAVNLAPFLGSLVIVGLLWRAVPGERIARPALLFWLNPAVILVAPVLGYQDTVFGAFAVAAVLALMQGRHVAASALVVAAGLLKPQGALLLPVLGAVVLRETRPAVWLRAALAGGLTAAAVLAPWWTQGYLLSALDGCRRPLAQPNLSALGFNVWWIAGWLKDWSEAPWPLARIVSLQEFGAWAGWDARFVSRILLLGATAAIVVLLARVPRDDRRWIPLAAILQVHAYALLGTSVHENHSLLAVILAPLLMGRWRRAPTVLAATSAFLFLNLFLIAGLGRRITTQRFLLDLRAATGVDLSVLVAIAHVVLVVLLFEWALRMRADEAREGAPGR